MTQKIMECLFELHPSPTEVAAECDLPDLVAVTDYPAGDAQPTVPATFR